MKKIIRYLLMCSILITMFVTSLIQAAPDVIGIINISNGAQIFGAFEIEGMVQNNGQINRVAVKIGGGSWENATGIDRFSYQVNAQTNYGDLSITVGAFDAADNQVAEKTLNLTIIPEKPASDIVSGEYCEPLNVVFKATPEVTTYYTMDGTDPKINGIRYTGPIYVNQNTVIQAVNQSHNNQYSEIATLDLKINPATAPWFMVQYYEDQAMRIPIADPAYLKAGTYYLKVVSDRIFSGSPLINIDGPGSTNDVVSGGLIPISDYVFQYTRTIYADSAADGNTQESITISGTDIHGNPIQNLIPANVTKKAAFPDTQPPLPGNIWLTGRISTTIDPTPQLEIKYTSPDWMRLALSESGLATAPWVEYSFEYDEFDISKDGNGAKTIWVELKDRAGNIQNQHAFTNVYYDNTSLSFDIEYFSDSGLTQSLGKNPYLKAGTYYLKLTANQDLGSNPSLQIDAEGANNDVPSGLTVMVNPRIFYYTRTIVAESAAVGVTREQITVQGMNPSNLNSKAAYTDTQPPEVPVVRGPETTLELKPTWSWNGVIGATKYRYSFMDGSNWVETTATSYTPASNLALGHIYTLYVQAGDQAGNWSASGSFTVTVDTAPEIHVKQGMWDIPSGTGSHHFGDVSVGSFATATFTVLNYGFGSLNLTGSPRIQISGADASCFSATSQPTASVAPAGSSTFTIKFVPGSLGIKTATICIANDDNNENPYTFTMTGNGTVQALTLDTWASGEISAGGEVRAYAVSVTAGKSYGITWDDKYQGTGTYSCDVKVTAYRENFTTTYFSGVDSGYSAPQIVTAQENTIYIKVEGYYSNSVGSFALKTFINNPGINLKQGATNIVNGGNYNFGAAPVGSSSYATFTIENNGTGILNLTGSPCVQISGPGASSFIASSQPATTVAPNANTTFEIRFAPVSIDTKTATVSIMNNVYDQTPYTFTISGTATEAEILPLDTWTTGNISAAREVKAYRLNAETGKTYAVSWDDSGQGSGTYNGNVSLSAYHQDFTSAYFSNIDAGYGVPRYFTAQEDIVYVRVIGASTSTTGSFALKVYEVTPKAIIKVKQDYKNLPNGSGVFNYGNVRLGDTWQITFTIENIGSSALNLSGAPAIQISGSDASCFYVSSNPSQTIAPNGTTSFNINFKPPASGTRFATVSIPSNDPDQNPYTFTLTGSAAGEPLDTWIDGYISSPGLSHYYVFETKPGYNYAVSWDDLFGGSGSTTVNIKGSAYRKNLSTPYFEGIDSGYYSPQIITALENWIWVKVTSDDWGPFAVGNYRVKVSLQKPSISVSQGSAELSNGSGSYDFGNMALGASNPVVFTVKNSGNANLSLTGTPKVMMSGPDAACFNVTSQPYSPVSAGGSGSFEIRFVPTSPGNKTATVNIASNDPDRKTYTFTITGTATGSMETLPFDAWTGGNIGAAGEEKCYSFNATIGQDYCIGWDDSYQGSGAYTADIYVSAYRQNFTTSYFSNYDSGYTLPETITAQDSIIYLKVTGKGSATGSYALKIYPAAPRISLKQGGANVPNGAGKYDFGPVPLCTRGYRSFTIENTGIGDLRLTGSPSVQISGPDAASFYISSAPATWIGPNGSSSFTIGFISNSRGTKTATITITSTDVYNNTPYTFTVTGTGVGEFEPLPIETLKIDSIAPNEVKLYSVSVTPGTTYAVTWDDYSAGSDTYSGDIMVSAYCQDMSTSYFEYDNGFISARVIYPQENVVYLKVTGYNASASGSYSLKVFVPKSEATINVSQGDIDIPNGTGSYDFGKVSVFTSQSATFRVQNTGTPMLRLTGSPRVQISGPDAVYFSVSEPSSILYECQSSIIRIQFNPGDLQPRTATVSIINNDSDRTPYTFTITGTGAATELPLNTWTDDSISSDCYSKTYYLNCIPGKPYGFNWQDSWSGEAYTCWVKVTAYRSDLTTIYFQDVTTNYPAPYLFTALDNIIYFKVERLSLGGSFSVKPFLDESAMNLVQGTTVIPSGGNYDCGNVALGPGQLVTFTIENTGSGALNLTDTPKVRISGVDASSFRVVTEPPVAIGTNESGVFTIACEPASIGPKTATISIANNDPKGSPYTFTINGTGTMEGTLIPDAWTTGEIASEERKTYCLNVTPGRSYALTWDDGGDGSWTYTGDILVSACGLDFSANYFLARDNGYDSNFASFTAQDNLVYVIVQGKKAGTFALKAYVYEPVISVSDWRNTVISNGTGSSDFGDVSQCSYAERNFTILNSGNAQLKLTAYPSIKISGPDASYFTVSSTPSETIWPSSISGFYIRFAPTSPGPKTATVTIANNDPDQTPYTFTISGNGTGSFIPLTLENWTSGTLSSTVGLYSFTATPGTAYAIRWDDGYYGSGTYSGNIWVAAYRKDKINRYFYDIDTAYNYPMVITAEDDIVYLKVYHGTSGTYALLVSLSEPALDVKRDTTNIPNGTGSYNYGPVTVNTENSVYFTLKNLGDGPLHFTDNPPARLTGPDAASFSISGQPSTPINPNYSSNLYVRFAPTTVGTKTTTVSIVNDDPARSPYTFTITGYGAPAVEKTLALGSWTEGSIAAGEEKYYSFNATAGKKYAIIWDDSGQGSGTYTGDIKVTAYRSDFLTPYFAEINNGYTPPQFVINQDTTIYIKVAGFNPSSAGSFALKIAESIIHVKQDSTNILNGSGSYDFGSVDLSLRPSATFTIQNTGSATLNLTGSPKVQISGTDASCFSVTAQPFSPVYRNGSATFEVTFTPSDIGAKTATVSIGNDDAYCNPYTFTVTGTATATGIPLGAWNPDNLSTGQAKTYYFNTTPGTVYAVAWDDSFQGSGAYTCDVKVSAFRQNFNIAYFTNEDSSYASPKLITALDNRVYLEVFGAYADSAGSFALKPFLAVPVINLKQGVTNIPNQTGIHDYGNVSIGSNSSITFTIQNTGSANLNLTGTPKIQISGTDASLFSVTAQPASPVMINGSATFTVRFAPATLGIKTATVTITSDDPTNNPYTFTLIGTGSAIGVPLTLGAWNSSSLSAAAEVKTYHFMATPGTTYAIAWDDSYSGSGSYSCDIKVSVYRQDLTTTYYSNVDSGYYSPLTITAQDAIVYLKVAGYSSSSIGSFALKPSLIKPVISVKQGSTNIPNGTGIFNFENVAPGSPSSYSFTIQNTGSSSLNLTGSPPVQISGTDAAVFSVTTQPSSPVAANGSATFTLRFAPTDLGTKTATISIVSNDPDNSTYSFTVTGTGSNSGEELTVGSYIPKSIGAGETKLYWFSATPGKTYKIYWDDSYQGSGTYSCDIKVSGYRQNLSTTYFSYTDSAYNTPQTIVAQENFVYLKVAGYYSSAYGTFALKIVEI